MKILYYDCFSGISGDMNLGAMLDLGVDKEYLLAQLRLLCLEQEYEISIETAQKKGITGTMVEIRLSDRSQHEHEYKHVKTHGRTIKEIERIILGSSLSAGVKSRSLHTFHILADAEAKVHGITKEQVHFHEVGAVDAILDIVGAAVCLECLEVDKVMASAIELGGGLVRCEHGLLPVPAPAVAELLQGVPVKTGRVEFETTTPTGAAVLVANVGEYTNQIDFRIEKVGYGIGKRDLEIPNVLRVYLGRIFGEKAQQLPRAKVPGSDGEESRKLRWQNEVQWMLETNIDDMNPEIYEYVEEKLFAHGALDVYKTPIIMKKARPAVKLSVLASEDKVDKLQEVIFLETSAIGLRRYAVEKSMLWRKSTEIETKYGMVRVKCSYLDGRLLKYKAEYEDCKRLATENKVPLRQIYHQIDMEIGTKNRTV